VKEMARDRLRGSTELRAAEARGGLQTSERKWLKISTPTTVHDRRYLHFELRMPYPRLDALSATLQEVDDAPHPLPTILSVVETKH